MFSDKEETEPDFQRKHFQMVWYHGKVIMSYNKWTSEDLTLSITAIEIIECTIHRLCPCYCCCLTKLWQIVSISIRGVFLDIDRIERFNCRKCGMCEIISRCKSKLPIKWLGLVAVAPIVHNTVKYSTFDKHWKRRSNCS